MTDRRLTCEEALQQLFVYLDEELDPATSADVGRHLESCRECFSRAEFERRLRAKVGETAKREAPGRLYRRVADILARY